MSWLSFVISVARVVEQLPNHQSIAGLIAEPYTAFCCIPEKYYKHRCCDRLTNIIRQQLLLKT